MMFVAPKMNPIHSPTAIKCQQRQRSLWSHKRTAAHHGTHLRCKLLDVCLPEHFLPTNTFIEGGWAGHAASTSDGRHLEACCRKSNVRIVLCCLKPEVDVEVEALGSSNHHVILPSKWSNSAQVGRRARTVWVNQQTTQPPVFHRRRQTFRPTTLLAHTC